MFVNTSILLYANENIFVEEPIMIEERLCEIRKKQNLSQRKVADFLGIPQQQYSRYENGKFEIPVRYVITLCRFYGISADWLLGLTDGEP